MPNDNIANILAAARRIAVVGLSPKPARPSHKVAVYLLAVGYEVIPVNPGHSEILGCKCYPDLESIPGRVDIVNIFRRAAEVPAIVTSAIVAGAKVVWMQSGIVNEEAAVLAVEAGLTVVMDHCIKIAHSKLGGI
ncbi:MAG: CoA-binding protein [Deltaproteobacteria bacterium]|nr:CoA-binding protein [Deltaproteobacteria bacterium]